MNHFHGFSQDTLRSAHMLLITGDRAPPHPFAACVGGQACLKMLVAQGCVSVCLGFHNMGGESG